MSDILRIRNAQGQWEEVPVIRGKDGAPGKDGKSGEDYVITEADYDNIADIVLTKLTSAESVSV